MALLVPFEEVSQLLGEFNVDFARKGAEKQ